MYINRVAGFLLHKLDGASSHDSQDSAKIDSKAEQAEKIALDKRKEKDAGRNNLDAIFHNTVGIATFEPMLMAGDVQQAPAYVENILQETAKEGTEGFKKSGLIGGLMGALKGATTGVQTGYQNAYAAVLGTGMRMNLNNNQ